MKYKIVQAVDIESFELQINNLLADGWEPVGGVVIKPGTSLSDPRYVQAMIWEDFGLNEALGIFDQR